MTKEYLTNLQIYQPENFWPQSEVENTIYDSENYLPWKINALENFNGKGPREVAEYLTAWAVLAPSTHNRQPWSVNWNENTQLLTITCDEEALKSPSDKKGRQAHVSVGCFTANLELAESAYGTAPIYEFLTAGKQGGVEFDMSNTGNGNLQNPTILELIKRRRSYRGPFVEGFEISFRILKGLEAISKNEGITLRVVRDQRTKNLLGKAQALADQVVLTIPGFRRELANFLVPNDTIEEKVMPGNTFGLSDEEAGQVHSALSTDTQMPGHFAAGFPRSDQEGVIKASAAIVLLADKESPISLIKSGIVLEKMWLACQANGLGVRIMAGMIESPIHNFALKNILGERTRHPTVFACIGKPEKETWPKSPRQQIKF